MNRHIRRKHCPKMSASSTDGLRKRVAIDLGDLRAVLSTRDNATAMRMQLAKHVKEIVMLPGREAGQIR
jgi:hypothetical protein